MKLFYAGRMIVTALGMAIAMSLTSLFLWKSGWLATTSASFHAYHAESLAIQFVLTAIILLWCCWNRRSLQVFLIRIAPFVTIVSLLVSALPLVQGFGQWLFGFAVPIIGAQTLLFAWLYVVSLRDVEESLIALLLAWVLSFFVRTFFESFENATAALFSSLALAVIAAVLLQIQWRTISFDSPMATSSFAVNKVSYIHAIKNFWRSVVYCATFAFLAGVIRFLTIDTAVITIVNYASALAGLVSPLVLMALWRFRTIRYNIDGVFRFAFPLLILCLGLLPFAFGAPFVIVAAVIYMTYSFLSLSVQALAVQISHDYGIDPVFCFSFQILICLVGQVLGYALGAVSPWGKSFGVSSLAIVALGSMGFLTLALFITRALHPSRSEESRPVEFLSLARAGASLGQPESGEGLEFDENVPEGETGETKDSARFEDKTALRCDLIGKKYALSQREIEIMLLFARGHTIASIAKELYISDNTVKTHLRRMYIKLGIHKKQELFALINNYVD